MIARSCVGACLCCSFAGALLPSGIASVYAYDGGKTERRAGNPGADGGASHLAFGSTVKVTNKNNGRVVYVRINDRGPFTRGRIIDLSPAAAQQLGFDGLASVTVSSM
jgi:rare lipoprotein A